MLLSSIVEHLDYQLLQGNLKKEISGIAFDSRKVIKGSIFVAISGFSVDGHHFIPKAIANGASVIILDRNVKVDSDITVLKVKDSRDALARISANYYEQPSKDLNLVGITGTNGKTSTSYFLKAIFDHVQQTTGVIGTIGTVINGKVMNNDNTTPESLLLQKYFRNMADEKINNCIIEVSSHALNLSRVSYSTFHTGIFTNLSPDHLELHKTMEEYFAAKAKLFEFTNNYNIINADDVYGQRLIDRLQYSSPSLVTYGLNKNADIYASDIQYHMDDTIYTLNTPDGKIKLTVHLPGEIYVYNSLAAAACAYCHGISLKDIEQGIKSIDGIKGRMEVVYKRDAYRVVVDFSHTEDALQKALTTLRPYVKGKLIVVFGVYADLSASGYQKRDGMAKVASKYADLSIVTSDNPKNHDPYLIINDITRAMDKYHGDYKAILDREEAIRYVIDISSDEDTILIAGKGHETTQVIGDVEVPFNETEIVFDALKQKKQFVKLPY